MRVQIKWFRDAPLGATGPLARRYAYHCDFVECKNHDMMLRFEVGP